MGSVLLHEVLAQRGVASRIIQGFIVLDDAAVCHVWLEVLGETVDVGVDVLFALDPIMRRLPRGVSWRRCRALPDGCQLLTDDDYNENLRIVEAYARDRSAVWDRMPWMFNVARRRTTGRMYLLPCDLIRRRARRLWARRAGPCPCGAPPWTGPP